jgi:small subunit ribosomal protein S3
MVVEKLFVKEGIKEAEMEEYLAKRFERAGYSHTEIQRTPLGTRIIVYAHKPGLVIGRSGKRINEITEEVKQKFGFENPLVDVREVEQPFLDAHIVAQRIAGALERGINFKKVANYYLDRVLEAGATGIQIKVAGKLAGSERSRSQKFKRGFIAFSGDYADTLVDKGEAQATIKPGMIGIQVRIMKEMPKEVEVKELTEEKEFKDEKEIEKQEKSGETEEQK